MKKVFLIFFIAKIIFGQNFYSDKITSIIYDEPGLEKKFYELSSFDLNALVIKNLMNDLIKNQNSSSIESFKKIINNLKDQQVYYEINFADKFLKLENLSLIKEKISQYVKENSIRGFLFSNINLEDEIQYAIFENIIVEAAIIKPYLHVLVDKNSFTLNKQLYEKFIQEGIIDFIFDENRLVKNVNFSNEFVLKNYLKKLTPDCFYKLYLADVNLENKNFIFIQNKNSKKYFDKNLSVNFILTKKIDTLKLISDNKEILLPKNDWVIPYNYKINKDNSFSRTGNWIEFRRPFDRITNNNIYNLLCKTIYPSKVKINNEDVKIYKTGIFFNKIKLSAGLNKLKAESFDSKGNVTIYEDEVLLLPKSDDYNKLYIEENSIKPNENLTLTKKDFLTITFTGTLNQNGFVEILPTNKIYKCLNKNLNNKTEYSIQIPLADLLENEKYSVKLILQSNDNETNKITKTINTTFEIKNENDFPLLVTTNEYSLFEYTLAPIRLGAPLRNELPKNVILKSNGIFGDYYRIKLNETEEGYINKEFVNELPKGFVQPTYFLTSITALPDKNFDLVRIPYLENVPYDVYADPQLKRITISLYGVKTSSTWIIHKPNLRFIEEITWQQTSKETYKIYVNLKTDKIWGYELKPNGKELLLKIKYPPVYNLKNKNPLKGIKISIEAGHGGSNTGAISLSGIKEKDLNLDVSKKLESYLKKKGAEVFMVRNSDKDMTLLEKRTLAINSGANIHFSVHANSSEPTNEFLGANGTCTFYNNPFWAPFAENVFYKLTELDLAPFGSVGSFNYRVSRINEMPSILVEQAFMSHAEDEEKLADENFRNKMVEKIYFGLIEYLKIMSNK